MKHTSAREVKCYVSVKVSKYFTSHTSYRSSTMASDKVGHQRNSCPFTQSTTSTRKTYRYLSIKINQTIRHFSFQYLEAERLASLASRQLSDSQTAVFSAMRLASLVVGSNVLLKLLARREEAVGGGSVGNDNVPVDKPAAKKMGNQHQVFLGIAQRATS